ncbi:MAG: adenylate kinase [Halobacteriovorax sp.]|nr:adenylate kinase [Halobacteriovorax sp.]|tara:strand:+ start:8748 stop:9287 length:540 start_codon:yes stop_codon:yes gene_type:complete
MKKILVVGSSCTGKTSTARLIEKELGIPFTDMDDLFWKPNWGESSEEELRLKMTKATDAESWVMSGNFRRTNDITWARADAIVWLNLPFPVVLRQAIYRTLKRILTKESICNGNRETFSKVFFSRSSILMWVFRTYPTMFERYKEVQKKPLYKTYKFFEFHDHYEVRNWINSLKEQAKV